MVDAKATMRHIKEEISDIRRLQAETTKILRRVRMKGTDSRYPRPETNDRCEESTTINTRKVAQPEVGIHIQPEQDATTAATLSRLRETVSRMNRQHGCSTRTSMGSPDNSVIDKKKFDQHYKAPYTKI